MHENFVALSVRQEDANKRIVLRKILFFHDLFHFLIKIDNNNIKSTFKIVELMPPTSFFAVKL